MDSEIINLLGDTDIAGVSLLEWIVFTVILIVVAIGVHLLNHKAKKHSDEVLKEKAEDYLKKAEEIERTPMPFLMTVVLIMAVVAEAAGFSYIFSNYLIHDGSNSTYQIAAVLGSLVVAGVLVPLTHVTGQHFYYNKKVNKARSYIEQDENSYKFELVDNMIDIDNTHKDDMLSKSVRLLSRITFDWKGRNITKKIFLPLFTFIFIAVLAVGSYTVREQTYYQKMYDETNDFKESKLELKKKNNGEKEVSNLPAYLLESAGSSTERIHTGKLMAEKKSNEMTYFVLAFLFLAIQALGIYSGMAWGFIGRFSTKAYDIKKYYKK